MELGRVFFCVWAAGHVVRNLGVIDMIYYTGIGSRETPQDILLMMRMLGSKLARAGHVLRSGGAIGADSAFERGARSTGIPGTCEIFLPWKGFNNNPSELNTVCKDALAMAENLHPAWERGSFGARKLHARNCYQILGRNLNDPVSFVICWTVNGQRGGGTGQALRLAQKLNIPIYDLALKKDQLELADYTNKLG